MSNFRLIALVIAAFWVPCAGTQGLALQTKDAPKISSSNPVLADDEAFAEYQRVTAGTTPPKATYSPDPDFPELPTDTEPNGVVVMLIGVNARGRVEPVRVVRSSAPVFEKSAVTTVKTWRFKPAKKNGKAVPVQITVEMKFAR